MDCKIASVVLLPRNGIVNQSLVGRGWSEGSEDNRFLDSLDNFLRIIDQLKNLQIYALVTLPINKSEVEANLRFLCWYHIQESCSTVRNLIIWSSVKPSVVF